MIQDPSNNLESNFVLASKIKNSFVAHFEKAQQNVLPTTDTRSEDYAYKRGEYEAWWPFINQPCKSNALNGRNEAVKLLILIEFAVSCTCICHGFFGAELYFTE